jgi:cell wall-associated NlpC family hydrolase
MDYTSQYGRALSGIVLLLVLTGLVGCASTSSVSHQSAAEAQAAAPTSTKPQARPHRALAIAADMIGAPYRYGGTSPRGFDCSGLVYYAYSTAGIHAPRTTTEQYRKTKRVPVSRLQPGDLVFFTLSQGNISHVGIYAGDGRFIHAPSSGKLVGYASLHNPYWRVRLSGAGRPQ